MADANTYSTSALELIIRQKAKCFVLNATSIHANKSTAWTIDIVKTSK